MLNNVKRALITVLTLSFTVVGVLLAPIETKAYSSVALNSTHYRVEVSQTSNTNVTVSWAPSSNSNSRYIDVVHITGIVGDSRPVIYLALYGSDSVTFNMTSGVSTNWTISIDNTYNVGSELYNTGNISSYTSQILDEIQDLNSFLVTMNSNNLQTQAYVSNINNQIQNIISNGLKVKLMNYDIQISQIPIISYFINNGATFVAGTNDFLGNNYMFLDYPILTGYNNSSTWDTAQNALYMRTGFKYVLVLLTRGTLSMFNASRFYILGSDDYPSSNVILGNSSTVRLSATAQINFIPLSSSVDTYFKFYWTGATAIGLVQQNQYIPLYFGLVDNCPDDIKQLIGIKTSEEEELYNNESDFNTSVNDLNNIESDYNTELDSQLQNVNTDFDFEDEFGSSFLSSSQWVVTQFNYIINNSPIGGIIKFSLIIGIALLIVGKKRGK